MPTVISGTTLNALTTVSWGVMSLFANNEQGVWFDPSDLNNYMSGLGPELITNSTFNSNITGWTTHNSPTTSIDSQRVKIIGTGGSSGIYQDVTLDASKSYEIKGLITTDAASTQTCSITLREGGAGTFSSISGYSDVYAAAGTSANARWVLSGRSVVRIFLVAGYAASGGIAYFDNISVKELTTISSATMFQDAAGTIPVTAVEQPVGLILDKSKGLVLGSEIITLDANRDFSSDTGYWTKGTGATISGGTANFSSAFGYVLYRGGVLPVGTLGSYYEVTFTVSNYVSGSIRPYFGGTPTFGTAVSANGTYNQRFCPTSGTEFGFSANVAFTGSIDNISVKQVLGNHASQSTAASRPVLSARVNLLRYSEQFDNAAWTKNGLVTTGMANVTTAPDGTQTADQFVETDASGTHIAYVNVSGSKADTCSIVAKANTRSVVTISCHDDSGSNWTAAAFNLSAGTSATAQAGGTFSGASSITPLGNDWYRCTLSVTSSGNAVSQVKYGVANSATPTFGSYGDYNYTGDGSSGILIWGADLRFTNVGTNLPPYQRVGAAVTTTTNPTVTGVPDYDTNGFPLYLKFDGVDDSLATASIDFSVTDKMSVFAGVRKLSDAQQGFIAHIGDGGANDFMLQNYTDASFYWGAGGSNFVQINSPNISSPATRVLTGLSNISADSLIFRVNGSSSATSSSDQGTGQFSNSTLKVGSIDGGLSKHYNGHLYNLIIRGALSNSVDIINTEAYINSKTKAY